jgi:hypothetical protein
MAEDTNQMRASHLPKTLQFLKRALSFSNVRPWREISWSGEKFLQAFDTEQGGFPSPIRLRIEAGYGTGRSSDLAPSLSACALRRALYNHAGLTTRFT